MHRARARGAARGPAHGRAVLGDRPDERAEGSRTSWPSSRTAHDHHRHAQHAAGGARERLHGVLPAGEDGRAGASWSSTTARRICSRARTTSAPRTTSPVGSASPSGATGPSLRAGMGSVERSRGAASLATRSLTIVAFERSRRWAAILARKQRGHEEISNARAVPPGTARH